MSTRMDGNLPEQHYSPYSQMPYTNYTPLPNQASTTEQESFNPSSYADQHGTPAPPPADAFSVAPEKPGVTKPILEAHVSQPPSPVGSVAEKPHLFSQRHDFLLDWALKILGVASAILFGIWAPISYKITADGNAGNDASQASLMSEISSMRDEAATAASAQRSVVSVLSKVQNQLDNAGLLQAFEFCSGKSDRVCTDLTSSADISQVLSSLGGLSRTLSPSRTSSSAPPATSIASPENGSSKGGTSSENLLAIILGSVFGAIVVIGLIVGILTKKPQRRRLIEESRI